MSKNIRAFIAIPLPSNVIEQIGALQSKLKESGFKIRWVKPANIHLTLKFLGDIAPEKIAEIEKQLHVAVADHPPLTLAAKGIGVFPGIRKPRVLWVGVSGQTQDLRNLHQSVDSGMHRVGFAVEKRKFKSHLTLGRIKSFIDPDRLVQTMQSCSEFESESFNAERIHLYQSRLEPSGAVYTKLLTVPLKDQ